MPPPTFIPPSREGEANPELPTTHPKTYSKSLPDLPTGYTDNTIGPTAADAATQTQNNNATYYHSGLNLHLSFPPGAIEHARTIEFPPFTGYLPPHLVGIKSGKGTHCLPAALRPSNIVRFGKRLGGGVHGRVVERLRGEKRRVELEVISAPLKGTGRRVRYYATWGS